jgi:hypothetical protein
VFRSKENTKEHPTMMRPTIDLSTFNLSDDGFSEEQRSRYSGGFGSIVTTIRSDLDREQYRIRNKIHQVRYRSHESQDYQEEVRRVVEAEHQNLIDRLLYLENQLAENENEYSRLQDEVEQMRRERSRSRRVTIVDSPRQSPRGGFTYGSMSSPISLSGYK